MGNYKDLEYEFVERTLKLIEQYEGIVNNFKFEEQYNRTLMINCLLGLIVMPKERIISFIPKQKLTAEAKKEIGLENSTINPSITDLKNLIISLRHSVAHFFIKVISKSDDFLIDEIVFFDNENGKEYEILKVQANELLPFLKFYSQWLLANYKKYGATTSQ